MCVLMLYMLLVNGSYAKTIYVDSASVSANTDGLSWTNAFPHLQDGLKKATKNDEIRVASGTYYTSYRNNKNDFFSIPSDIKIFGGFRRGTDVRFENNSETVLSADFLSDDSIFGDSILNNGNNGYRVVVCEEGNFVTLDGLTIRGGYGKEDSNAAIQFAGSGLYLLAWNNDNDANVTMRNCKVKFNTGNGKGAGVYFKGSTCQFVKCEFIGNRSIGNDRAGNIGGGIYIDAYTALVDSCLIRNNKAIHGGGIFFNGVTCTSIDNTFQFNRSHGGGGAINFTGNNLLIDNNTFENNLCADGVGGAIAFKGRILKMNRSHARENNSYGAGGVLDFQGDTCDIMASEFTDNSTLSYGGVFKVLGKKMSFDSCTFTNNSVRTKNGGVIYCEGDSLIIKSSVFDKNTAKKGNGGVLHFSGKQADITDSKFNENASMYGGAIYAEQDVYRTSNCIKIKKCIFGENSAIKTGNALCFYGNAQIESCSFTSLNVLQKNVIDNRVHKVGEKVWYMNMMASVDSIQNEFEINASVNNKIKDCNFVNKIKQKKEIIAWYGIETGCLYTQQDASLKGLNKNTSVTMINK